MMRHGNMTALHRTLTDNVIFFLFYNVKSQFFISLPSLSFQCLYLSKYRYYIHSAQIYNLKYSTLS